MGAPGKLDLKDAYIATDGERPLMGVSPVWLIVGIVVLTSLLAFLLGYLYGKESIPKDAFIIEGAGEPVPAVLGVDDATSEKISPTAPSAAKVLGATTGAYVASKNGTAYHLPTCTGAKQIKEENKVWFATKADAELAGYKPAKNCKGI